jgi:hypothetical protein
VWLPDPVSLDMPRLPLTMHDRTPRKLVTSGASEQRVPWRAGTVAVHARPGRSVLWRSAPGPVSCIMYPSCMQGRSGCPGARSWGCDARAADPHTCSTRPRGACCPVLAVRCTQGAQLGIACCLVCPLLPLLLDGNTCGKRRVCFALVRQSRTLWWR